MLTVVVYCHCCCFAAKEEPSDELPNIPPPKQKKRTKPKLDAVKASKLATGLLSFLSPNHYPIGGGGAVGGEEVSDASPIKFYSIS